MIETLNIKFLTLSVLQGKGSWWKKLVS